MVENREIITINSFKETRKSGLAALQAEWEAKLAKEGLAPIKKPLTQELSEAGLEGDSLDELAETEHDIKESLDQGVVTENMFSSETPLNKCGLPPCQRAKFEDERGVVEKNQKLGV
jgi:hypothetical protein